MLSVFVLIRTLIHDSTRGYVAAGLIAGAAILFKRSLGIANAYGMCLAVCAVGALEAEPTRRSRVAMPAALSLWFLAAIAPMMPFTSAMSPLDYTVHFLPFHLLMASVAAAVLMRGGIGALVSSFIARLSALVLGLAVLPGVTALVYAHWGSLGDLIFNMFVFPTTVPDYYVAVPVPPFPSPT